MTKVVYIVVLIAIGYIIGCKWPGLCQKLGM
jgi:hypothetical protein